MHVGKFNSAEFSSSCRFQNKTESTSTPKPNLAAELLAQKVKEQEKNTEQDDDSKKSEQSEQDIANRKRANKYGLIVLGSLILIGTADLIYVYGPPKKDDDGNEIPDEYTALDFEYIRRAYGEVKLFKKSMRVPSREKLLPDPLQYPYIQPKYTLVLELKDILLHPQWSLQNGWRFKKRPGVEYLLQNCVQTFEIVLICNDPALSLAPVIDKLDPQGMAPYRLYQDSLYYVDGKYIKELKAFNRDLSKIILVDHDPKSSTCPRNQLIIPKWDGINKDGSLFELAEMLKTIADADVEDVRDVLDTYKDYSDPVCAFMEKRREVQAAEAEALEERKKSGNKTNWSPSLLSRWF